uniref:CN hydrolase domain-containing protein n=1 Tax=Cuerna arida TaxID=1464854 RepID=A0A1B6F3X2_9HEMI
MLLLALLFLLAADLNSAADFYTAAVVEYHAPAEPNLPADEVLLNNAKVFVDYMNNASAQQVDLIVFPEGGLHGHESRNKFIEVPSPSDEIVPCDHNATYHPALVLLSCSSRHSRMYVVVNLSEKFYNSTNGTEYYNTNVAFDRNGTVVGRYRKFNPYGESVNKPPLPDHHYFETDFGVRFGMFTCFDIEFLEPAIVMARQFGIRHFIFPLCWISELPFLTALQMQWGWAYSLDVVLLAAGCNNPQSGGSGTGIYVGKEGALETFQTNAVTSKMLIRQVPVNVTKGTNYSSASTVYLDTSQRYFTDSPEIIEVHLSDKVASGDTSTLAQTNSTLEMLKDYLDVYETFPLVPTPAPPGPSGSVNISTTWDKTLCQNGLCCRLQLQMTNTFSTSPPTEMNRGDDFSRYPYRLVMFDGVRWYGGGIATGGVQVCGIVSCVNDSISSCGLRADDSSRRVQTIGSSDSYGILYKTATVFESIIITPIFSYNSTLIFPDIFVTGNGDNYGSLVSSKSFSFITSEPYDGFVLNSLHIEGPILNLITAAVYSRQFDRDGQKRTELSNAARSVVPHSIFMMCVILFVLSSFY